MAAAVALAGLAAAGCGNSSSPNGDNGGAHEPGPGSLVFEPILEMGTNAAAYRVRPGTARGVVSIPALRGGIPIRSIGGFANNTAVTGINFDLSIERLEIEPNAFHGAAIDGNIAIPKGVFKIGDFAFYGSAIRVLTFAPRPDDEHIEIGSSAFAETRNLTSSIPNLPNGVTIGDFAFHRSTIENITIPTGASVGVAAFHGWTASQRINIPYVTLSEANTAWGGAAWKEGSNAPIFNNASPAAVQVWPLGGTTTTAAVTPRLR